jgi:hypothetical protein
VAREGDGASRLCVLLAVVDRTTGRRSFNEYVSGLNSKPSAEVSASVLPDSSVAWLDSRNAAIPAELTPVFSWHIACNSSALA